MRRLAFLLALISAVAPATAAADDALVRKLTRQMRVSGAYSGAYVINVSQGQPVFRWKQDTQRILASNTKLFTTAAALARYGSEGTLGTEVVGDSEVSGDGIWRGDLYLRGGGDPTFGSHRFVRRYYGRGATVERLAALIEEAGIERITGRVYGDESRFDSLRGGPESRYATSIWVGPLSGLAFNRGLGDEQGRSFQVDPPRYAAAQLDAALERRGVSVRLKARAGVAPAGAQVLASVDSPPMERLIALTNEPSDNFFAEMLLKDLALQTRGRGTTAAGAKLAAGFARRLGSGARLVDGSGLSRGNRASPRQVVRLLTEMYAVDQERVRRRLHRFIGHRRFGGHACRPDAIGPRASPLRGQDRNALRRERTLGLLRGSQRRPLRLFDSHERRIPHPRPRPAGQDGAGHRRPERLKPSERRSDPRRHGVAPKSGGLAFRSARAWDPGGHDRRQHEDGRGDRKRLRVAGLPRKGRAGDHRTGDDRGRELGADRPTYRAHDRVHARGDAGLRGKHRFHHEIGHGGEREPDPEPMIAVPTRNCHSWACSMASQPKAAAQATVPRRSGSRDPYRVPSQPLSGPAMSITSVEGTRKRPASITEAPKP